MVRTKECRETKRSKKEKGKHRPRPDALKDGGEQGGGGREGADEEEEEENSRKKKRRRKEKETEKDREKTKEEEGKQRRRNDVLQGDGEEGDAGVDRHREDKSTKSRKQRKKDRKGREEEEGEREKRGGNREAGPDKAEQSKRTEKSRKRAPFNFVLQFVSICQEFSFTCSLFGARGGVRQTRLTIVRR